MISFLKINLSLLAFNASPSLRIHTPSLPGGTGKRRLGVGGHALVSVRVPRTLDYRTINLNPIMSACALSALIVLLVVNVLCKMDLAMTRKF